MRHKLRLFSLVLIIVLIFSFTACTAPKTATETTAEVTTITETTVASTTAETTTTQAETTTAAETMSNTSLESDKEGGEYPSPVGWVNDFAGIFKQEDIDKMNELITDLEKKTTAEIYVATVNSLNGKSIEMYANELFNTWGIGKKDIGKGVLFLVALNERKFYIKYGYGLENVITNVVASRILDEIATPSFKKGEYGQGSYEVVKKLSEYILAAAAPETTAPETTSTGTTALKQHLLKRN